MAVTKRTTTSIPTQDKPQLTPIRPSSTSKTKQQPIYNSFPEDIDRLGATPGKARLALYLLREDACDYTKVHVLNQPKWDKKYLQEFCVIGGKILAEKNQDKQQEMAWRFAARSFIAGLDDWIPEILLQNAFSEENLMGNDSGIVVEQATLNNVIAELQKSTAWDLLIAEYLKIMGMLTFNNLTIDLTHAAHTYQLAMDGYIAGMLTKGQPLSSIFTRTIRE